MISSTASSTPKAVYAAMAAIGCGAYYAPLFVVPAVGVGALGIGAFIAVATYREKSHVRRAYDFTLPDVTDAELEELRKVLRKRKAVTNNELADLLDITKGEASKRVSKAVAAGILSRQRIGKEVAIRLH